MSKAILLGLVGSALLAAAEPISDSEIRRRTSAIEKLAVTEPPSMGLDSLLTTAQLVQPYTPAETHRLHAAAVRHAQQHPDVKITSAAVRRWIELDPDNGESDLRKLKQRRRVLEALVSYYNSKRRPERAVPLAIEVIETAHDDTFSESTTLRVIATANPEKAVECFAPLADKPQWRYFADSAQGLFDGLFEAVNSHPAEVRKALEKLKVIVSAEDYAKDSETIITTQFEFDGRKIKTADNRSTALECIALLESFLDPAKRYAAREAERTRITNFTMRSTSPGARPPISPDLPLEEALAKIDGLEPARMRLGELWRYLIGKPRTEEEARPIVNKLIEWADNAPYEADPFWFQYSLLNLDGRLGPPGKQWVLPSALRPALFHGAARAGQRMERDPERFSELIEAMRAEKVPIPADVPSAKARDMFLQLRGDLEGRYDFTLSSLDGEKRRLQAERGKVVVLNFWATWCGPCREEMPAITRVYESMRPNGVEVFAITDEAVEKVKGFVEKNPLALPVLFDPDRKVFEHYRVQGLPKRS